MQVPAAPPVKSGVNPLAALGLAFSLICPVVMCLMAFSLLNPLLEVIPLAGQMAALGFCVIGLVQIRKSGGSQGGRWMAITGIGISVLLMVVILAILSLGLFAAIAIPSS